MVFIMNADAQAHGNCEFEWVGNILIYKLSGSFNEEGVIKLYNERITLLNKMPFEKWFRIVTLSDDTIGSIEASKMGSVLEQKSMEEGCLGSIFVISSRYIKNIRQHQEKSLDNKSTHTDTLESALATFKQHESFIPN